MRRDKERTEAQKGEHLPSKSQKDTWDPICISTVSASYSRNELHPFHSKKIEVFIVVCFFLWFDLVLLCPGQLFLFICISRSTRSPSDNSYPYMKNEPAIEKRVLGLPCLFKEFLYPCTTMMFCSLLSAFVTVVLSVK